MADGWNLHTIRDLPALMQRTDDGSQLMQLAERLGWVTPAMHQAHQFPSPFPSELPDSPAELSRLMTVWTREGGRAGQLVGLLQAQEKRLQAESKRARALARSAVRRDAAATAKQDADAAIAAGARAVKPVKLTASEINDLAEERAEVQEADEKLVFIQAMLAMAQTHRETVLTYIQLISREYSFRGDQMRAGVL